MKRFSILLINVIIIQFGISQNQANIWHICHGVGLDFNNGEPVPTSYNPPISRNAYSTICDENGNLLFSCNAKQITNKNNVVMQNGDNIIGQNNSSQGIVIVQKPGSDHLYYVFSVDFGQFVDLGMHYSIVDMNLDGGLGAVTSEKNVEIEAGYDAFDKLNAAYHANGKDIWIIVRKYTEDSYASFLLTENGLNPEPVISPTRDINNLVDPDATIGTMKLSYDKKYLVTANKFEEGDDPYIVTFDVNRFNSQTGDVEFLYTIALNIGLPTSDIEPFAVEFSPDSKFLYLTAYNQINSPDNFMELYQYEMQYIEDSLAFIQSSVIIAQGPVNGLQLARDGKIYCTGFDYGSYDYISVINKPWEKGTACDYQADAIYMGNEKVYWFLPNQLLDYLLRFEWDNNCSGIPINFKPNFIPDPQNIIWDFGDGSATTTELWPVHTYDQAGEYEISVVVHYYPTDNYPNGRIERTSRVIEINASPQVDLGADMEICEGSSVELTAGSDPGFYVWSTGVFGDDKFSITVSDTGTYWVEVTNEADCAVRDSIHIAYYPKTTIDETNLTIIPTSCAGTSGQILGLSAIGTAPLTYEWYDASGNFIVTGSDITGLGVGNYYLKVTDGNGCEITSNAYTITDAGDVVVTDVVSNDTHCGQSIGSIEITAEPSPTDLLYSIDNGNTWQTGDWVFNNLAADNYEILAKDISGCVGVYSNSVIINDIPGPVVSSVNVTDEIDNLANGQIDISTTVSSGSAYYSIDNGSNFQTDNGLFQNLSAGTYPCIVKDDFACDTTFEVVVGKIYSQIIDAIAGDGNTCLGDAAVVPVKFDNFYDVKKFNLKLTYDISILNCDAYINAHPDFEQDLQVSIIPTTDEIIIAWEGDKPLSLEDNAILLELVFTPKQEGTSGIDWAAQAGESWFFNENLEEINAQYHVGTLKVFSRPQIIMGDEKQLCVGDLYMNTPVIMGGSGHYSQFQYHWQGPNYNSYDPELWIPDIQQQASGTYTFTAIDTLGCEESKSVELTVYPSPEIAFADTDTIFADPGFELDAGGDEQSDTYAWSTGDSSKIITPQQEGIYTVTVTNSGGCESEKTVTVLWGGVPFVLPNAFSPNGDGLNDIFIPVRRYDMVKKYHLMIFNRWGQQIFETQNIDQGWDGTYQGKPSPYGTYVYKIIYTAYPNYEESKVETGQVILMR